MFCHLLHVMYVSHHSHTNEPFLQLGHITHYKAKNHGRLRLLDQLLMWCFCQSWRILVSVCSSPVVRYLCQSPWLILVSVCSSPVVRYLCQSPWFILVSVCSSPVVRYLCQSPWFILISVRPPLYIYTRCLLCCYARDVHESSWLSVMWSVNICCMPVIMAESDVCLLCPLTSDVCQADGWFRRLLRHA